MRKDTQDHIATLKDWISKAREEAQRHDRHQTKQAVQNQPMSAEESEAAGHLFALHEDIIFSIAKEEYDKRQVGHADRVGVELDDVLQESYILMLRALVMYKGGTFRNHLRNAFRDRLRDYLDSQLQVYDPGEANRPAIPNNSTAGRSTALPGFQVHSIVGDMVEDGDLSSTAEEQAEIEDLWDRLT